MSNTTLTNPEAKLYGLVRDKNGKPRIDGDPRQLPDPIKRMLTTEELTNAIKEFEDGQ